MLDERVVTAKGAREVSVALGRSLRRGLQLPGIRRGYIPHCQLQRLCDLPASECNARRKDESDRQA